MPFGFRNCPATLHRSLDLIRSVFRYKTCLVYLDDVLIFSRKLENHIKHVDEVLPLFENACLPKSLHLPVLPQALGLPQSRAST